MLNTLQSQLGIIGIYSSGYNLYGKFMYFRTRISYYFTEANERKLLIGFRE